MSSLEVHEQAESIDLETNRKSKLVDSKKVFLFQEIPLATFEQKGRTVDVTNEKNDVKLQAC